MIHNYDNYNYWQIDPYELPTHGFMYPDNVKIKIRSMSVLEVKFLATLLPETATTVCNEILEKCTILENMDYDDLYLPDREYLIFWIRLNSFTTKAGYTISIPQCTECGKSIEEELELGNIKFKYLDKPFIDHVFLPDARKKIKLAIPKYKDSNIVTNDEIEDLALYIDNNKMDFDEKIDFIKNITAYDFITLKSVIDENYCGVNRNYVIVCNNCQKPHNVQLTINDQNLFNSVNLMQILETITRIAKYANLQITNDWPWIEVEVESKIIEQMIQEENERNKAELNRAKQQAHSVSVPHTPSMPSMPSRPSVHY